ncbi:MAG: cation transporter [Bacteroidales bacterium]|nr:cation transporter [Bacteroidales bacterium]
MKTERNIFIAFVLNLFFSVFELFGGLFTGSIAILSDSLHDFGDALSIGVSYYLEKKSKREPDEKFTYGYIKYSVIGSVITTTILLAGSIFVIIESIRRLINPADINYNGMLFIAVFGVIVNLVATFYTREGDSLNQKAVNLHMLEDVLGWIVVLIGAIVMKFTCISIIDPILSILVALFILYNACKNMKEVLNLFLERTPEDVDIKELKEHLLNIDGVDDVHHIHVRSIDGFNNIATLHAVVKKYDSDIKNKIKEELKEHNIGHSTIEFEIEGEECDEENCEINIDKEEHHHHHHPHHHH